MATYTSVFAQKFRKAFAAVGLGIRPAEDTLDAYVPVIKSKIVTLTAAQVRTLNATPVTVVAAPGSGKALVVMGWHVWYDYATAAYDAVASGDDLALKYTNASGAQAAVKIAGAGFADQTSDQHRYAPGTITETTPVENAALVAHILVGEWYSAAGAGTLTIQVQYMEIPFSPVA